MLRIGAVYVLALLGLLSTTEAAPAHEPQGSLVDRVFAVEASVEALAASVESGFSSIAADLAETKAYVDFGVWV